MRRRELLLLGGAAGVAAALPRALRAGGTVTRSQKRLLIVFATGGWDTCYALDPKEPAYCDVPAGAVQQFAGLDIFTDSSRPHVTDYFTRYAANTAVIRGISTDAINHAECQRRIATGTREETSADLGAMVSHDLGNALPIPYLILGDTAFTGPYAVGAARVGTTNQIVDLVGAPPLDRAAPAPRPALSPTEEALLASYANASADRARAQRGALGYNRARVDDFAEALARAGRLEALRGRFGVRGQTLSLADQIPLALDALQQDLSHAVMLTTRLAWDTHSDNHYQADCHETAFAGLAQLVGELMRRPGRTTGSLMIDDTVVAVISELSRTPRLGGGDPAHAGKNHWPITSAMVIGAGVKGGQVFGATTPDSQAIAIDLATGLASPGGTKPLYSHFIAGVLALCGVDPSLHLAVDPFDAFAV